MRSDVDQGDAVSSLEHYLENHLSAKQQENMKFHPKKATIYDTLRNR